MIKSIILLSLLSGYMSGQAQYKGYALVDHPESFKKNFAQASSATLSVQSDFRQEKTLVMLSEKIISSGKFWYSKKDKLRMEYLHPFSYLLILNGGKIYTKDGQKENRFSAGSARVFQQVNRILFDCVSGSVLDNANFESRIFESGSSFMIEMNPRVKNLREIYKNINIVVDKKDFTVTAIEMYEVSGDITVIRFLNKTINAQIPDQVFNIP